MVDNLLNNMSYTNKSFQDVYEELLGLAEKISYRWNPKESNESDPGVVLLKLCAIIADKLNYNIDKNVLECFPVSVTQESNARKLFEQLGYFMGWYKGASGNIQISWKGENTGYIYNLPRFSMVSNDDSSIVYTLTSDVAISSDGSVAICPAIQGVIQDFMVNGDAIITTQNLDSNNRIYFSNSNIAENGIFITNNLFGYDDWKKVNNLEVENYGTPVYKFGVSSENGVCYLEFPEDAYNIFGDGIRIKYISTDGQDGNVSSKIITKFFNDPSAYYVNINNDEQSILLTTEEVYVTNNDSIRNGENPETIEDAYKNYQKTIGTFDTLVTLRDYNNAIRSAEINNINIVSNGFVTDRTNDIQCSYKIVTDVQDIRKTVYSTEEESEAPLIDAFDLKLYLLENIQSSGDIIQSSNKIATSASTYNTTFNLLDNTEYSESYKIDMIKQAIDETKCVQHDFQPLLSNRLCMLKNKYPVECKIIPQYKLTSVQSNSVKSNIIKALYNNLNSRKIGFGEEISYDALYTIILNSDERIKSVILGDINYTTYAVYYNPVDMKYDEIEINSMDNFIVGYFNSSNGKFYYNYSDGNYENEITIIDNILYKDCSSTETEQIKTVYVTAQEEDNIVNGNSFKVGTKLMVRFGYDAMPEGTGAEILKVQIVNSQNNANVGQPYEIKEYINGSYQDLSYSKSLCWKSGSRRLLTFNGTYWVIDFESSYSNRNSLYTFVDLPTGQCYKYTTGRASRDIKAEIQADIYAKSVLGGVTQLLQPDDIFEYRMNQRFVEYVSDVANISTNANIHVESPSDEASRTLRNNECIRFYSPNLEDDVTYSSYVKFQYAISQDIDVDTDYMLQGDETITFYWKESDDENASYKYRKYGAGTIIHPNFSLRTQVGYMTLDSANSRYGVSYSHDYDEVQYIGLRYPVGTGTCNFSDSSKLSSIYSNDYILSSTKSIIIRKKIEATINYPMYAYWILNDKTSSSSGKYVYKLFDEYVLKPEESSIRQTYILQPGEYFIYTNASKSSFEILSAGTKITRTSNERKVSAMVCEASDTDEVINTGVSSIDDILKQINYNETITATEMQIKTVPANATIYLSALSWEPDSSAALSASELTGTRIYGEGNSPMNGNTSLVASPGRTVYNNEYSSSWQWHEDEDGDGNTVYSESGFLYGTNTNLDILTSSDVSGKTPVMLGVQPGESYVNVSSLSAPEFYDGEFYQLVNGEYVLLEDVPNDWQTNYTSYYWKKPNHAYNPKFSTSLVWEDDENIEFSDRTPYISIWSEDQDYIALGFKVEQENLFPDLIKLDHTPTDYGECGYIEQSSPYNFGYWWNLSGKSQQEIQNILRDISTKKYFKCGDDWYQNMRYSGDMSESLPKTTYHAYNPKFRLNGYLWNETNAPENSNDLQGYIRITGENCSPQRCIIVPEVGIIVFKKTWYNDMWVKRVWVGVSYGRYWQQLNDKPSDSNSSNTYEGYITDISYYNAREFYDYYTYICTIDYNSNTKTWYQNTYTSESNWKDVSSSYTVEELLSMPDAVEIEFDLGGEDLESDMVSIIPKPGMKAINVPTESSAVEVYNTQYFNVIEDYIEKSWTQTIEFDQSVTELSGNSYVSPVTENISPTLGSHAYHQYDSVVWLEDYSYAFEDNAVSGVGNVLGNARSVSGVGASPISEGIEATQDGKAYNPAFSYRYYWNEDSNYQYGNNPIAVLTGQQTPYTNNISVLAIDQHIINPNYISGYKWTRLNSIPNKYTSTQTLSDDVRRGTVLSYSSPDTGKEPPYDAEYYTSALYAFNDGTNPNVWYQKTPLYGKSWTSVREPIGKSWTAYNCEVSDSWTSVNEYTGKSWHSQNDSIPMLWRSVPTAVNVIFKKDGAEIISPPGYELNDFVIKSQLEDSSEVEEWPKVIVDDGWEAYSSLNLTVSKNVPFEIYENQELEWFSKDYNKSSNDTQQTHGYIDGRYVFEDVGNISTSTYDYLMYRASVSNVTIKSENLIKCRFLPENGIHLYCRENNRSWLAEYSYYFVQDATASTDGILVDSITENSYTINGEEVFIDSAGIHCYEVINGNPVSWTSYQSVDQHWEEQPQQDYSEYGVRIVSVTSATTGYIDASTYAQQSVALVSNDSNYVGTYIPVYILSDYGYDIEGGNMVDVSRLNLEGNVQYMNIYAYELIEYSDEDISMDGNLLKINVSYSEYVRNDDSAWASGQYYSRVGSGTASDPYYYLVLTSKPSDWDLYYTNYYVKTNKLDENYSITKEIDFNFNTGKYLLKFMNSSPDIKSLTMSVVPVVNGVPNLSSAVVLSEFGDTSFIDYYKSRKYYIDLNTENLKNNYVPFANCDLMRLYINIEFKTPTTSYYETKGYLSFDLSYKYDKPNNMSSDFFDAVVNRIEILDKDRLYDFSYVVDKDVLIENPIDSASFLNVNHIYNGFTICQIDTDNSDVYITNSAK